MEIISALNYFSIFLSCIYVVVSCSFILGWSKIKLFKKNNAIAKTRVSILISARNEEEGIAETIADLLAQNYPKELTEIIIVDDHSTDQTAKVVLAHANSQLRLIQLDEADALNSYKKKAIQVALAASSGQLIVTTDADCRMGSNWLSTLVNYYETTGCKMISAPVAYFKEQNAFEKIQSLEFAYLIGIGASTIGNQYPSTCNGANLAYERAAFLEVDGFNGIDHLASGDDELLLHKIAAIHKDKIGFLKNQDAIVYTYAKPTLKELIRQRKRWASKSTSYKDKKVMILGISMWLFNAFLLLNAILSLFVNDPFIFTILLIQVGLKMLVEFIFLNQVTDFFKRKQLLVLLPLLSLSHVIYMVYIGIAGNTGKYVWKDRIVK